MKITAIQIKNVRGFQNLPKLELAKNINIFIGPNNSGKSTLLNSIFLIQRPQVLTTEDITIGQTTGEIELYYEGYHHPQIPKNPDNNRLVFHLHTNRRFHGMKNGQMIENLNPIPEQEPFNLIYPYLSKRKAVKYSDIINEANSNSVTGNFANLYSKIDRLITPQLQPGNTQYIEACNNVLGFQISTLAKGGGKQAVYFVHNLEHIPLNAMGEGVANILGLITDLCVAENKIFLIEEPENDIHPKALKALLKLITDKSSNNQFFISTHSNIVMKYLGSIPDSKIFNVTNELKDNTRKNLFVSKISEVTSNPEQRRIVLEELGYEFFDFDLWKGWIFLEESSAEVIIRDYLIEWFVKPLKNKVRTFSALGSGNLICKFDDFQRLFVFLHLEPAYKNKVWILIDGGKDEKLVLDKMKEKYIPIGWNESNFHQFKKHDFELYYPKRFQTKIKKTLEITEKQKKREAKKQLLNEVLLWIKENEIIAKKEFSKSAIEIIEILKLINRNINN
jgi:AAA15 family ATPase/GTPase